MVSPHQALSSNSTTEEAVEVTTSDGGMTYIPCQLSDVNVLMQILILNVLAVHSSLLAYSLREAFLGW